MSLGAGEVGSISHLEEKCNSHTVTERTREHLSIFRIDSCTFEGSVFLL